MTLPYRSFDFKFSYVPTLFLGRGVFQDLLKKIETLPPSTVVVVTGNHSYTHTTHFEQLSEKIKAHALSLYHVRCPEEPSPEVIDPPCRELRQTKLSLVVGLGGGSALDAAKAIAAMWHEKESVIRYLEGVGDLKPSGKRAPLFMVPTTSGTGSEATNNAVISVVGPKGFKKSLRHENYIPDEVYLDSDLLVHSPPHLTAACGMDALTQLLESYLSTKATPLTDALAYSGLEQAFASFLLCCGKGELPFDHPKMHHHRLQMGYAAMLSGICLARSGLGVVHGYASPIGALCKVPHGSVCANLLPIATQVNVDAMRERDPTNPALGKLAKVARLLLPTCPNEYEGVSYLITQLQRYLGVLEIPRLGSFGLKNEEIVAMAQQVSQKTNPVLLTKEEVIRIGVARL